MIPFDPLYFHTGKRQPEAEIEIEPLSKELKSVMKVPQKKKHETSFSYAVPFPTLLKKLKMITT